MRTMLLAAVLMIAACGGKPDPLAPIPHESGKKSCMSSADCASGSCGSDGRCR